MGHLLEEEQLQEGMFQDAMAWIKEKGSAAKDATINFLRNLKVELEETKEGALLLAKLAKGEDLTPEESAQLKTQMADVGKGLPLLALVLAPGGGIATVALVKIARKFGIDLMPTAFQDKGK